MIKRKYSKFKKGRIKRNKGIPKAWSLKKADDRFRVLMLETEPIKCVFPNCTETRPEKLTVSHYHGRAKKGTRFLKDNCVFLCRNHHYWDKQIGWEFQKQREENPKHGWDGLYTLFMKKKLGLDRFYELDVLAAQRISPKKAIQQFQDSLNQKRR